MPFPSLKPLILISIFSLLLYQPSLLAVQQRIQPGQFETITLQLNILTSVHNNSFHSLWRPSTGFDCSFGTDFYPGMAEAGMIAMQFNSRSSELPDFNGYFIYIGWGKSFQLPFGLSWFGSMRAGDYHMRFDDEEIVAPLRAENELCASIETQLSRMFYRQVEVSVSLVHLTVFTRKRIYLNFASAGLRYTMETPCWLKEFLK